ncbi:MAG TPA: HEAT repeat domain-containing protein [Bryobacteraceae bacterium]|nr:HEAT repeat domain-containing protein [Bryobacteraceae bacterium]
MKNDPILAALAGLEPELGGSEAGRKELRKALAAKSNLVVAKAARIVGEALCTELAADLTGAFHRFLPRGADADKGCGALTAIARALVTLDVDDPELFRRGIKHVQMEPVWGGSEDTAAELRAVCAMGLANSRDPRKLRDLVELLADTKSRARAGAVRALAAAGSDGASLVLRYKALLGDEDPEVVSDCVSGLLAMDGAEAMPLVKSLARSKDQDLREATILALGASRRADAIGFLCEYFESTADRDTKRSILLALASARTESAIGFLLNLIRDGSPASADLAAKAMSIHQADATLQPALEAALAGRSDKLGK